ncbi:MAG: Type II secretion system protein E [Parcubacteria group bacterium Gr01-1014_48]|nr:MAG: Type II secretion system protein E [Parcubacteria group bacterium Greene0416_14]TSC71925.1 MAG: Type II secretion system protein E [Parcubacteria group bacterium Gr01-1014_48]TSD01096.1 MAG: Type II secretion system protein E [Parcubacteria group bacterium Greene1014_15]TSD07966.1 MAG: Type II secretion system protein E [Parcubacteria group bacterium Greene0714_4]
MSYLEILAEKNLISKETLLDLEKRNSVAPGDVLAELMRSGVGAKAILQAKGEYSGIPVRDLGMDTVPFEVLKIIPEESAIHYRVVPLAVKNRILEVGITDPDNMDALDALNFVSAKSNLPFKVFLLSDEDLNKVLQMYRGLTGEVSEALTEYASELEATGEELDLTKSEKIGGVGEEVKIIEEAPVTKIVATILRYAVEGTASDVHVEPIGERTRVRFRVDGVLHTSLLLPLKVHPAVVARIKILSNIKLDEKRKPQDGRFSARILGREVDFRVSTFPTNFGEKVVLRILEREQGIKTLDSLDLAPYNLEMIKNAINLPYGLIVISGPTGSGKSTTLYAMLNELDRESDNVVSLEDPIEYYIKGVSQSQVMPEIQYTFANGLRSILRQDPDIIMVGEIRDKETAQLAIQAALTGHLVLTTLHTNTAIGVIPRLVDMGVDPFLIAPTVRLMMAQRLVQVLCPDGGESMPIEGRVKTLIDENFRDLPAKYLDRVPFGTEVRRAAPTPTCPNGTRGRVAVFEMLQMDRGLEKIILENPTEIEIGKAARERGMFTMKEDAIIKAFQKKIPFEDISTL